MRSCWPILLALSFIVVVVLGVAAAIPLLARRFYGPPAAWLKPPQVLEYSARLLWAGDRLSMPLDANGPETAFEVQPGESVASVCTRLEQLGIVTDGSALRDYLIYTGQDTSMQAGSYRLSPAMSVMEVARQMQDATPTEVEFVVLAGWRIEEIADALPTSGLAIGAEEFIRAAHSPATGYDFLEAASTHEGFLFPGTYVIPRSSHVGYLLDALIHGFAQNLSPGLQQGFAAQGLSVREAVILASIVQREAVRSEEAPLIASVYLNRLRAGMRLDADPTVQYALGFNAAQQTWWTNPLSLEDLKVDSQYSTYRVSGLPPAPISNPGMEALRALSAPATSPYYYFNARCDGSGYHVFSEDFQEHLGNLCP